MRAWPVRLSCWMLISARSSTLSSSRAAGDLAERCRRDPRGLCSAHLAAARGTLSSPPVARPGCTARAVGVSLIASWLAATRCLAVAASREPESVWQIARRYRQRNAGTSGSGTHSAPVPLDGSFAYLRLLACGAAGGQTRATAAFPCVKPCNTRLPGKRPTNSARIQNGIFQQRHQTRDDLSCRRCGHLLGPKSNVTSLPQ